MDIDKLVYGKDFSEIEAIYINWYNRYKKLPVHHGIGSQYAHIRIQKVFNIRRELLSRLTQLTHSLE